mgnify:CR=1 FL=1
MASTAGLMGYPYVSAYTAAKHGVIGLTRALAAEPELVICDEVTSALDQLVGEEILRVTLSRFVYDRIASRMTLQAACERGLSLFDKSVPVGIVAITKREVGGSCNREWAWAIERQ